MSFGDLVALGAAILWALTSLMARWLSRFMPPLWCNTLRCTVSAGVTLLLLLPLALAQTDLSTVPLSAFVFLAGSVLMGMGIGDTVFFESIRRLGVSRAMPLASTHPLLTATLAVPLFGEEISVVLIVGAVIVGAGVWLITSEGGSTITSRSADPRELLLGVGFALLAATCWALSSVLVKPAMQSVDPLLASSVRMPLAALLLVTTTQLRRGTRHMPSLSRKVWVWMLITGLVTTASMTVFLWSVALIGATRTAAISSSAPLFVAPLAILLFREPLTARLVLGTLVTVVGLVLVITG